MKKILRFLILIILFSVTNTFALNVKQANISIKDKSEDIIIKSSNVGNLSVASDVEFKNDGDFITYQLVLHDDDNSKYQITGVSDDNTCDNFSLTYQYDDELNKKDKTLLITLTYKKTDDTIVKTNLRDISINIVCMDEAGEEQIINPQTGNLFQKMIIFSFFSMLLLATIILKKNHLFVLILCVVPISTFATSGGMVFTIKVDNIKFEEKKTSLLPGPELNLKIQEIASVNDNSKDQITAIKKANKLADGLGEFNIISDPSSYGKIYMWLEDEILYFYSENGKYYLSSDSEFAFSEFSSLKDIEDLKYFDTKYLANMDSMFEDCTSLSDVSSLSNWKDIRASYKDIFKNTQVVNYPEWYK